MIPALRLYGLLLVGGAIAALLAWNIAPDHRGAIAVAGAIGYDLVLLGLGWIDSRRVRPHRVEVRRLTLPRLSINRDNPVTLTVESSRRAVLCIYDQYPVEFAASPPEFRQELPANHSQDLIYTVHPTKRGEYGWDDIRVRQLGPWGLAWHSWIIPQQQTVAVYPDLVGLRALTIRLTLQSTGALRQMRQRGIGTEFAELKDYGRGDDPRLIDWKATARRDRPLVRVLEPEHEQTLIILLDRGRLMTAQVQGIQRFDWGLNAALSLAVAGLNRGDRVGMAVFDRQIHTWIPPERGQHHLGKLIERLTPIQPTLLEPDYFGAANALVNKQTRRALVVMITEIVDAIASAELLAAMGRLSPRYLPFCVTLRDPEVDQQAHTQSETLTGAYARAVALDLLDQRQLAFAKLKQQGVLVLDAPVHQISNQLVDRYLQLKARGQL
ncbi:MAG: DUF58 domain-containing protein [Synechococcales bacterium]|nr:DUF58 domain-containing protein [Synechococcales bacterium]